MSAPIASSTAAASPASASEMRPQVQSRRVSLQLGPLGISYSTDQVLWSSATADAAATAVEASAARAQPGILASAAARESSGQAADDAAEAGQAEAQAGRTFSQEMLAAWRRQAGERAQTSQTYGPDGALPGEEADLVEAAGASRDATQPAQTQAVPAGRVRQAIAAYLACARQYGQASPMLTAMA